MIVVQTYNTYLVGLSLDVLLVSDILSERRRTYLELTSNLGRTLFVVCHCSLFAWFLKVVVVDWKMFLSESTGVI